uniref:Uncharacterized protein n=1 Tax=Rangifer tarandus platyrhynchus TaxID=3082113 RepID=A0ACB0E8C2_RANTA|nr:unnamed protein product [Rangifer tarandus platyrhynchus]
MWEQVNTQEPHSPPKPSPAAPCQLGVGIRKLVAGSKQAVTVPCPMRLASSVLQYLGRVSKGSNFPSASGPSRSQVGMEYTKGTALSGLQGGHLSPGDPCSSGQSRPSAALLPLAHGFSQAGSLDAAPGVSAKARRSLPELTQGSCAEDGVNRLSVKVTSSDSGSSGRRKLQSFFRAVNARRKTH